MPTHEEKTCAVCGRRIEWRAKWAKNWDAVRYCSGACRRTRLDDLDRRFERDILETLRALPSRGTVTPQRIVERADAAAARDAHERARRAARRLVANGDVELLQNGRTVDPSTARGPFDIRLR